LNELEQLLAFLDVRTSADDLAVIEGPAPAFGESEYVFGGVTICQAVAAATLNVPAGRRLHSMHAYFLRPVANGTPLTYRVVAVREGRTYSARRLEAEQFGKPVLTMTYSLGGDDDGYVYDLGGLGDVPMPDDVESGEGPGPWVDAWVGPSEPAEDGTRESTHRAWFRIPDPLPDDVHLHTALVGFCTDWTGIGGRPLHLEGDTTGMVSLDHAVWFHRPPRADEWLLFDVHSLVNAGGRGLLRGVMRDRDGRAIVSVAQEMVLTPM
jgi:acyl-CoA thioesterase-2